MSNRPNLRTSASMAPAVLADSDDDGDGEDLVLEVRVASLTRPSTLSTTNCTTHVSEAPNHQANGRSKQGQKLKHQPDVSFPTFSPSKKRRRTVMADIGANSSRVDGDLKPKRVKTVGNRSCGSRSSQPSDIFAELQPLCSSAKLSNNSSAGHTMGCITEDFDAHEPFIMFPESGSTIRNTDPMQQYTPRAVSSPDAITQPRLEVLHAHEDLNSSIPYIGSPRLRPGHRDDLLLDHDPPSKSAQNIHSSADQFSNQADKTACMSDQEPKSISRKQSDALRAQPTTGLPPSPVVEIPYKTSDQVDTTHVSASAKVAQIESDTDSIKHLRTTCGGEILSLGHDIFEDSDLPTEKSQPRPSRRTRLAAEPIAPETKREEAARLKRSKNEKKPTSQSPNDIVTDDQGCKLRKPDILADRYQTNEHPGSNEIEEPPHSTIQSHRVADPRPPNKAAQGNASGRPRRFHTTIFEDHVDMTRVPHLGNLSQQQAVRDKSLEHSATKRTATRGSLEPQNEINDEDELCSVNMIKFVNTNSKPTKEHQQSATSKPKRGRGRPPTRKKSDAFTESKSAEIMELDFESNRLNMLPETPAEHEKGCPSQTADTEQLIDLASKSSHNVVTSVLAGAEHVTPFRIDPSPTNVSAEHGLESPRATIKSSAAAVTESEHQSGDTLVSKRAHSPIKNSSKVPLRVGLNKRQRIPSLLRTIKPPRPPR